VSKIRKRNKQVVRCSGGVGIFYKEKLYHRIQLLNNVGPNVLWIILKAEEGKEGKIYIWVPDECRREKEMVMKALINWARGKTCQNRYELVERKRQYKEIMEKKRKNGKIGMRKILKGLIKSSRATSHVKWLKYVF
jgi:hypothetical protein